VGSNNDHGQAEDCASCGAVYLYQFTDSTFSNDGSATDGTGALQGIIGDGYNTRTKDIDLTLEVGDVFSRSVSLDGTRLAIGAEGDDGATNAVSASGAVYLYNFTDTSFSGGTLQANIGSSYAGGKNIDQSLDASDEFGIATSLDGTQLAVGAFGDDGSADSDSDRGAVYLYSFTDSLFSGGTLEAIIGSDYTGGKNIDNDDIDDFDSFGGAVSLDSNRLAVGSFQKDSKGAVYLYSFTDSVFSGGNLDATIGDGFVGVKDIDQTLDIFDLFGRSVSLDGNRLAVSAVFDQGLSNASTDGGAVYLYSFTDAAFSGGALEATIGGGYIGAKDINQSLGSRDIFGHSISLDGTLLAVGASSDDGSSDTNFGAGAVYLYSFTDAAFSGGALEATIGSGYTTGKNVNQTLDSGDGFGHGVSLDSDRLAVGAYLDDGFGDAVTDSGAVYLYSFTDSAFSGGNLEATIGDGYTGGKNINQNLDTSDQFGRSVTLDGLHLGVGATGDDGSGNTIASSGAVYLYQFGDTSFNSSEDPITDAVFATRSSEDITLSASTLATLLTTPQNVTLQANNDINVSSAVTVNNGAGDGGNLTLQAGRSVLINANITTDNGDLTITGNETLANGVVDAQRDSGAAVITMTGSTIDAGSGNISITLADGTGKTNTASGDITLNTVTTTGNLTVDNSGPTAGSDILQTGILTIGGTGSFTSGTANNNITLTNTANAITGALSFTTTGTGDVTLDNGTTATNLGTVSIGRNLDVTAGNAITDSGVLTVGGTSSFTTDVANQSITLDTTTNALTGAISFSTTGTGDVTLDNGTTATNLGTVSVGRNLAVTAGNAITDSGVLTVGGTSSFTTDVANQSITLDTTTNALTGAISFSTTGTGDASLINNTSTILAASTVGDVLTVEATGAGSDININGSQTATSIILTAVDDILHNSGTLTVSDGLVMQAGDGITIDSAVNATGTGTVHLEADSPHSASNDGTGQLSIRSTVNTAGGAVTLIGAVFGFGSGTVNSGAGNINLAQSQDSRAFDLTGADTSLDQLLTTGILTIGQATTKGTDGLGTGAVTLTAGAITVDNLTQDAKNITLISNSTINDDDDVGAAIQTTGTLTLTSGGAIGTAVDGEGLNIDVPTLVITSTDGNTAKVDNGTTNLDLGTINTGAGAFGVRTGGSITDSGVLTVAGNSSFTTDVANQSITLDTTTNALTGAISFSTTGTGDVTLDNGTTATNLGTVSVGRNLVVTAGAAITDSGVLTVGGTSSFTTDVANQSITLDTTTNALTGAVNFSTTGTGDASLTNNTSTILGASTVGDALTVDATGAGSSINVNGALNATSILLTADNDIVLNSGTLTASGSGNSLILATTNNGDFTNNVGAGVLAAASGRWLIYSTDPANDTLGGLVPDKKRYNTTFPTIPGSFGASDDGALYSIAPTLTITADDKNRVYGDSNPALTFPSSGFIDGDTVGTALTGSITTTAVSTSNVGTFAITQGTLADLLGYTISFTNGTLTVTARALTITADASQTKVYGASDPTFTQSITSGALQFTDTLTGASSRAAGEDVGNFAISQGSLTVSDGNSGNNYSITYVSDNFAITPRPITFTADAGQTKVVGASDPTLTQTITSGALQFTDTLTGSLTRAVGESVGNFAISQGTLTVADGNGGANYSIAFVGDNFSITAGSVTPPPPPIVPPPAEIPKDDFEPSEEASSANYFNPEYSLVISEQRSEMEALISMDIEELMRTTVEFAEREVKNFSIVETYSFLDFGVLNEIGLEDLMQILVEPIENISNKLSLVEIQRLVEDELMLTMKPEDLMGIKVEQVEKLILEFNILEPEQDSEIYEGCVLNSILNGVGNGCANQI
jgi:hypothetical protein